MTTTDTEAFSDNLNTGTRSKYDGDQSTRTERTLPLPGVIKYRVFMNQVDTFHIKHIASFLVDQIAGKLAAAAAEEGEEEEEEEEGEEAPPKEAVPPPTGDKYEVIGTLLSPLHKKSEDILYTIDEGSETFMDEILKCRTVIYNIGQDEKEIPKALNTLQKIVEDIEKIAEVGPKTFQKYNDLRVFLLLSTVMTWGATKPIDPEEPDTPFNESDYKKRKPHPSYKDHIACEREVVLQGRKFKDKLRTYVVCAGVAYGEEEEDLGFFFKLAWTNEEYLPLFLPGTNRIPLIHIQDLSRVIHGLLELTPKKPQFILAVEQTPCTLKQIIKALTKKMGSGKLKEIAKEDAFLYPDITQSMYEKFTVNLNMEPTFIVDDMELEWKNEMNLAENMAAIIAEYKKALNLVPLKVVIHGPPGVGKTKLAEKISQIYGTQHLTVQKVIDNTIQQLRQKIEDEKERQKKKEQEEEEAKTAADDDDEEKAEEEQEEEEEEEVDIDAIQDQLREIDSAISSSENGRMPDDMLLKLVKKQLTTNKCFNQGYVLDGFPKTIEQTKALFGSGGDEGEEEADEEEGEEEGDEGGGARPKTTIIPDYVITLYATDDFLCKRIMQLPEKDIQGTHYTEENMLRRLAEYHARNTEDNTMLNFFDEMEIHPTVIDVMKQTEEDEEKEILKEAMTKLGPPIRFPPTLKEEEQMAECVEEEKRLKEEEKKLEDELCEKKAYIDYQNKMEAWVSSLEKLQLEEEKLIVAQCEPLRNYLVKYVFPTLTRGLMELAKLKPYDPVDFLAEYLFKENPEGHMFDPSYTKDGAALEEVQESTSVTVSRTTADTKQ